MKMIALAAALAIGGTAIAQDMPQTTTPDAPAPTPPADGTQPQDRGTTGAGSATPGTADPATPADPAQPMTPATPASPADPMGATPPAGAPMPATPPVAAPAPTAPDAMAEDPRGGYLPATPALSGPMTPGAKVVFRAAPSPAEAYPAPAPLKKYPVCKKGQTDKCMQRGG
jgi:hypothetical protein